MQIAQNNLKTIKNELLPRLSLYGLLRRQRLRRPAQPGLCAWQGRCSPPSPAVSPEPFRTPSITPRPEYQVGFQLCVTLRNRVAKADQFRAVLDYRQRELTYEQSKKSILLDVRNSQYALQQAQARVTAALKARDLAQKTFDIAKQEQKLGAMSSL